MVDPTSVIGRARSLRQDMMDTERWLWHRLRSRRLGGYKFVRQLPIAPFFADFGCREAKLVAEVDGSQHAGSLYDERRDAHIRSLGFRVLRFWNYEVARDIDAVCEAILDAIDGRLEPHDRYTVR